ncbi:uncharacterized protein JCM10292_006480 [Rhodotorula paludigena]|uniref:uncharacterized protein n=1 Tax=Rhodotorula paludigena TaxID=86838 RepID=UPI00317732B5
MDDKYEHQGQAWEPPTPKSSFVPLPTATTLPVDHLVLLPPPFLPHDSPAHRSHDFTASSSTAHAGTPASPRLPSLGESFDSLPVSPAPAPAPAPPAYDAEDAEWLPASSFAKRPRRSAAIVAARNIPRQPSPFDLEDDGGADADDVESPSASPPPGSGAAAGGRSAGAASKRKVSHSLIERRRREKINDCLATLRETVPSLKEEGEKKIARAKERGRKRGRGDEAGERGGLHKLEILQGTIGYIEQLRSRIAALEEAATRSPPAASSTSSPRPTATASASASRPESRDDAVQPVLGSGLPLPSPLLHAHSFGSSGGSSSEAGPAPVDDHEASMLLLNFSTSPELRPVVV